MINNNELIDQIKSYNKFLNHDSLNKAFKFAIDAHKNQKRDEGVPYIIHPVAVAKILTDLKKLMSLDNVRIKCNPYSFINTKELIMHLAWANIKLGNYKEAEIYLNRIEKFYEGYNMRKSFLLILRGCARCNLHNYQQGINDFAEAKKLDEKLIFLGQ